MKVFSHISEQFCHTLEAVLNSPHFHKRDIQQFPAKLFLCLG